MDPQKLVIASMREEQENDEMLETPFTFAAVKVELLEDYIITQGDSTNNCEFSEESCLFKKPHDLVEGVSGINSCETVIPEDEEALNNDVKPNLDNHDSYSKHTFIGENIKKEETTDHIDGKSVEYFVKKEADAHDYFDIKSRNLPTEIINEPLPLEDSLHTKPLPLDSTRKYSTSPGLVKHIKNSNEEVYKCNTCSYESSQFSELKRHAIIHTSKKSYKCSICTYECLKSSDFKRHLRIHTGEKLYKCSTCSFESSRFSSLKRHFKTHTGEKPYKCNTCLREFSELFHLKRHSRIHTGEKLHKCNICSYETSQASALTIHLRIHTGDKPYKCNICEYLFYQKSDLKRHLRIHTGEKPYKCSSCSYEVSDPSNFKRHLRIHTA